MAFVYIVRCADGTYYTGSALDLESRLRLHNAGRASKYTRSRRPVRLVYREQCRDLPAAYRREYRIKCLSRAEKEKLIGSAWRSGRKRSVGNEKRRPHA